MSSLPSGTVTFLFTDIEGSTQRWEQKPELMREAVARHDAVLREAVERHRGAVFKTVGDAVHAAFATAPDALLAALDGQRALAAAPWAADCDLRVRMALHTGNSQERDQDYFGQAVNRVARLLGAGHGGQILLSATTQALLGEQLAGTTLRDLGEHRLRDLSQPEHIYQVVAPDLPGEFPPLRVLDMRLTVLSAAPTRFVGREREIEAISALLLRPDVRLLVLTGAGGTGKTRLALRVGEALQEEFAHGVVFVSLAALTDPALVAATMARVLEVETRGSDPVETALAAYLEDKHLLLILDNFEQVRAAAPVVAGLLATCPRLTILVTSRAVLHLYEEHDFPVPPLAVPTPGRDRDAASILEYDAVALFLQRVRAVKPNFAVRDEQAQAIAELCRQLDGLPLAIELAAARIRILSPQAMLARLARRLEVLTGGASNLPTRQQTLRGTIDWSYGLLDPEEQVLFSRLGIFMGGCSLEAVEAICNLGGDLTLDSLDAMTTLVEQSLVQQEEGPNGEARFLLLETIQEYALERLAGRQEIEETRRRHAAYYLTLAEAEEKALQGPTHVEGMNRLEAEHDNLRAALGFSIESGDAETALRLAGSLAWLFWYLGGYWQEGQSWLERALALPAATGVLRARAKALLGAGSLAYLSSDLALARSALAASLSVAEEADDRWTMGRVFHEQAWLSAAEGDIQTARSLEERSLALARADEDRWAIADRLHSLGALLLYSQAYEPAREMLEDSASRARALGNWLVAYPLNALGDLARAQGDYRRAARCYEESLRFWNELGLPGTRAIALHNLGHVLHAQGEDRRAAELFAEALSAFRRLGDRRGVAECLVGLAGAYASMGPEWAVVLFGAAARLLDDNRIQLWPSNRADYERDFAVARAGLARDAFQAAWEQGYAMTPEEAVAGPP